MSLYVKGRDLLSLADLDRSECDQILRFARELKSRSRSGEPMDLLSEVQLFTFDPERVMPSWDPFGRAIARLGGQARRIRPDEINVAWGENFLDLFAQLDGVGNGLAMASVKEGEGHRFLTDAAELMQNPVLNMLSEEAAPFQALASLMTLEEHLGEELDSARICLCWAPPALAFKPASLSLSLAEILLRRDLDLRLSCPLEFQPGFEFSERMEAIVPGALRISDDPMDAMQDADVLFAINWGVAGQQADAEETERVWQQYTDWMLTQERVELVAPKALLGGGLPQGRDREVAAALLDGPQSIHLAETVNLLHVTAAVLALVLDLNQEPPHEPDTSH